METITRTRPGRPRKNPPVSVNVAEGEDASGIDNGNREVGTIGHSTQPVATGANKGLDWNGMIQYVKDNNSADKRISLVIHPDADGLIITDNMGNIRTEKGLSAIQLNTGEIIRM